ncbi:hypothetical protein AN1130.2 [Aspergillus nidulans FGSC A4]|nr:hypothetical protein AN1130.2 [Aspergillus nidulans FGSC A4]|eukprot:XP_658734.1 hypothetical protein AN1130.2 [Aspergillus nidulans FGSC A4]
MAEALGIASGVAGIISLGLEITQGLLKFYAAWRNQDAEIDSMYNALSSLSSLLAQIQRKIQPPAAFDIETKRDVEKCIAATLANLEQLNAELGKIRETGPCWDFRLTADCRSDKISEAVEKVDLIIRWRQDDKTREIIDWLSPTNFWLRQADVLKQRQPGTVEWLLQDSRFLDWETGGRGILWCQGSLVVDFLETDLPSPDISLAFVYCNHKASQDQSPEYFHRAIARQLVEQKQAMPGSASELYQRHRGKETAPTESECLKLLQSLSIDSAETYVVIDALDELALQLSIREVDILTKGSLYDEAMQRLMSSSTAQLALRVIAWVVYSLRPLKIIELQHAVAIDELESEDEDIPEECLIDQTKIINACVGLIRIDEESQTIGLVHYTTQEYFDQRGSHYFPSAQVDIGIACVRYLQLGTFGSGRCSSVEQLDDRLARNPFLDYACRHFCDHIRDELECKDLHQLAVQLFLDRPRMLCAAQVLLDDPLGRLWWRDRRLREIGEGFEAIHFAANFGVLPIISPLLKERDCDLNLKDFQGRTPLSHAASNGHESVVKLFLQHGAQADSKTDSGQTPLIFAVVHGHESVVKLLLQHGAQADSKTISGKTPLSYAASKGKESVVRLLLQHGAQADSKNNTGQTPISYAASKGHESVVRLLLTHGAQADSKANWGQTPLSRAAFDGHESVVRLFLEHGAQADCKDGDGGTPLSSAAATGHESVVRLLLKHGAQADSKDDDCRTPLSYAASNGYESVVKLLLEHGARADSKDDDFRTPLSYAASYGYESVVKLLLEHGARTDSKDKDSQTPLSYAASRGYESVVRILLENGARANSRDKDSHTPLSYAASKGHESVVRLLLQYGAQADSETSSGQTPLSYAASHGHEFVVKLLLDHGAQTESKDKYGWTPLVYAAIWGQESAVRLLLEHGAEAELKDNESWTPLSYAALKGHESVVRLLLDHGAQADSKHGNGRTPLSDAASRGYDSVVRLLLEHGARED